MTAARTNGRRERQAVNSHALLWRPDAIRCRATTLDAIRANSLKKGDVLAVARIAGIMAAKRTSETIPLCHPIALTDIGVDFTLDESLPGVRVETHARTIGTNRG